MRTLYHLTFTRDGRTVGRELVAHVDFDSDEQRLRELVLDACRRDGRNISEVGDYLLELRKRPRGSADHTYVTTEAD